MAQPAMPNIKSISKLLVSRDIQYLFHSLSQYDFVPLGRKILALPEPSINFVLSDIVLTLVYPNVK